MAQCTPEGPPFWAEMSVKLKIGQIDSKVPGEGIHEVSRIVASATEVGLKAGMRSDSLRRHGQVLRDECDNSC